MDEVKPAVMAEVTRVCPFCGGVAIDAALAQSPTPLAHSEEREKQARKLLVRFYASSSFNPKAARHADTVEAAILYTLAALCTPAEETRS